MVENTLITVILAIPLVFLANNGLHCLEVNISIENETVLQYKTPTLITDDNGKNKTPPVIRKKRTYNVDHQKTASDVNGICIKHLSLSRSKSSPKQGPIHKVIVGDEGTPVSLTCHFCNDSNTVVYSSILWYQISRVVSGKSGLPISEVVTDMKDNEKENRVIVTPTHTLIFKNIKEVDAGGYFCMARENMTTLIESGSIAHISNISHMLSIFSNISFFYHVDVLPSSEAIVKRVSLYSRGYEKPSEQEFSRFNNLLFFTDWQEWTRCSVCGSVGERQRYGVRMVSKIDRRVTSKPWFLDKVLSTYTQGVPCRSTLLQDVKNITAKPDEIEVELCDITCHRRWIYSDDNTQKAKITNQKWREISDEGKHKVVRRILRGTIGEMIKMDCPGTNLNSLVWWKNGTKTLNYMGFNNSTNTRVQVDPYGNLIIDDVEPSDKGKYSCWLRGKLRAIYKFIVQPQKEQARGVLYHLPYIGTILSFHFWLFVSSLLCGYTKYKIHPSTEEDDYHDDDIDHHTDVDCFNKVFVRDDGYSGDTDDYVPLDYNRTYNTTVTRNNVCTDNAPCNNRTDNTAFGDTSDTHHAVKSTSSNDNLDNSGRKTTRSGLIKPHRFTHDTTMSNSLIAKHSDSKTSLFNQKKKRPVLTAGKMSLSSDSDSETIYAGRRFDTLMEQQPLMRTYHLY